MLIITIHDKVIINCVSFAYYKLRQLFYYYNYDKVLPNCDRYYKLSNKLLEFMKAISDYDRTSSSW